MNKASGSDEFQLSCFKDDAVKVLHSIWPANLENTAVATGLEKSVFIPVTNKGIAKECSNYCKIVLIGHASKVMLKTLQSRLQQHKNGKLPDVQAGLQLSMN